MNVNSGHADFSTDSLNPQFNITISDLSKLNEITISATDVYNNTQITQYKIEKPKATSQSLPIETPIASFENEIFVDNNGPDVFIQNQNKRRQFNRSPLWLMVLSHRSIQPILTLNFLPGLKLPRKPKLPSL